MEDIIHLCRSEVLALPDNQTPSKEDYVRVALLNQKRKQNWYIHLLDRPCVSNTNPNLISSKPVASLSFQTVASNIAVYPGVPFYYEVQIVEHNLVQIGYMSTLSTPLRSGRSVGVGDDNYSWAVDGYRGKIWNADFHGMSTTEFPRWNKGDTVGVCIDLPLDKEFGSLSITINGYPCQHKAIVINVAELIELGGFPVFPALSFEYEHTSAQFVFDAKQFKHKIPKGYSAINMKNKEKVSWNFAINVDTKIQKITWS